MFSRSCSFAGQISTLVIGDIDMCKKSNSASFPSVCVLRAGNPHHALCGLQAWEGLGQQHGLLAHLSYPAAGALREPAGRIFGEDPNLRTRSGGLPSSLNLAQYTFDGHSLVSWFFCEPRNDQSSKVKRVVHTVVDYVLVWVLQAF